MSFSLNVPPSVLAKMAKNGEGAEGVETTESDAVPSSKKREDWKKLKELEEARKAGTAPAMQDEHGKDINPHIPQYIMQAPWYFGAMQPTLSHQRQQDENTKSYTSMGDWYKKGVREGAVATKYRKGACENCGALTHKRKDCLERPRKIGAKFTGTEIAPDEFIQPNLGFDYEGKRDRWNGYDVNEHKRIFEEYARIEEAKKELKSNQLDQSMQKERDEEAAGERKVDDDDEDEDKYADDVDMPGQKFETKQRITVRNLRIREDTAKYLYNLDVNSAYYDPKTRSMRDNPFGKQGKDAAETKYAGDNFVRWSGDAHDMATQQMFAWEAYEKGQEVHLQADPTKLQLLTKEYTDRKKQYKDNVKQSILDRYGGEKHLEAPPKQLLLAQSEDYVEYSRHGRVIKGQEKAIAKSRYEEDIYINNHKCVWGSYWSEGKWGFRCCHSFIKESYCTGDAGKSALQVNLLEEEDGGHDAVEDEVPEVPETKSPVREKEQGESNKKKKRAKKKRRKKKKKVESSSDSSDSSSEDEDTAKERRIKESMAKLKERDKEMTKLMAMDERKRPYNVMYDLSAPTEEDMEAYRRKRVREEDPMAQFLS